MYGVNPYMWIGMSATHKVDNKIWDCQYEVGLWSVYYLLLCGGFNPLKNVFIVFRKLVGVQ